MCVEGREVGGKAHAKHVGACDPLELELRTVVSHPTRVLWKSRTWSSLLNHLSSFPPSRTFRKIGKSGVQNDGTHMKASTRERNISHTLDSKTA